MEVRQYDLSELRAWTCSRVLQRVQRPCGARLPLRPDPYPIPTLNIPPHSLESRSVFADHALNIFTLSYYPFSRATFRAPLRVYQPELYVRRGGVGPYDV